MSSCESKSGSTSCVQRFLFAHSQLLSDGNSNSTLTIQYFVVDNVYFYYYNNNISFILHAACWRPLFDLRYYVVFLFFELHFIGIARPHSQHIMCLELFVALRTHVSMFLLTMNVVLFLCRVFPKLFRCILKERGRPTEQPNALQLQEARDRPQGSSVHGIQGDIGKRGEGRGHAKLIAPSA